MVLCLLLYLEILWLVTKEGFLTVKFRVVCQGSKWFVWGMNIFPKLFLNPTDICQLSFQGWDLKHNIATYWSMVLAFKVLETDVRVEFFSHSFWIILFFYLLSMKTYKRHQKKKMKSLVNQNLVTYITNIYLFTIATICNFPMLCPCLRAQSSSKPHFLSSFVHNHSYPHTFLSTAFLVTLYSTASPLLPFVKSPVN